MTEDLLMTCSDCGQEFTFSMEDQAFFQERGGRRVAHWIKATVQPERYHNRIDPTQLALTLQPGGLP